MISLGEEPVPSSRPLPARYDAAERLAWRAMTPQRRLEEALALNAGARQTDRG